MAAVIQPNRLPAPRPALRLVPGGAVTRSSAQALPSTAQLIALAAAVLCTVVLAIAVGRGALAALAPAPPAAAAAAPTAAAAGGTELVVRSGDTLWSLARQLQPTGDVRDLVDRLAAAHGAGVLQPGDRIVLPV